MLYVIVVKVKVNVLSRFYYAMVNRPFDICCQPVGQIDYFEKSKLIDRCYGVVVYDRRLTNEEVKSFELKRLEDYVE